MKRKLFFLLALMLTSISTWADTDKLPAADGWTKITDVPTASEIANNYYVFVDATQDLMLGFGKGVHQNTKWYSLGVYYRTSVSSTSKDINQMVWTLEAVDGVFAMRNLEQPGQVFQTEWGAGEKWDTNDVISPNTWARLSLAYSDGLWTIQNGYYPAGYLGPWDNVIENGAECAANKTGNDVGKFHIYAISRTQFQQNLLDNASASNPVDVTPFYVTNATFNAGNRDGWTEEGTEGNNNTSYGGGCEIWHRSDFNIHQDVTVPNGNYKVSLQMAGTTGAGKVYGTSNGTTEEAASSAAAGSNFQNTILSMIQDPEYGQTITDEITVSNGTLTIGMKCETTDQWINFDNFKLYCTGLDLSAFISAYNDALDAANSVNQEAPMNATVLSALQTAISTYSSVVEEKAALVEATSALNSAYSNATASISNYESALAILNAASSFDAAGQASYAANETVAAIQSAYDDRTLVSVSSAQQEACAAALRTAALAQTTENSDMTLAIVNPSFETANSDGWTVESTGSNVNLAFPNSAAFTKKDGIYFAERYQPNGTIEINQTINVVSAGVYKVEVSALARGDISSANFYANSVSTPITNVDAANDYSVNVALDANSDLKIGLTVVATASGGTSWLAFDNFRLTYLGGLPDVEAVTGKMNGTVEAAQTAAIEAYEANKTVANYNAASAAIAAAQASKDAYTTGKSALDKVEEILANTNVYTDDAYTTFNGAYTTAAAKYEASTWTNEEATGYNSTTFGTGWHSTASVDDFLISAWDETPHNWDSYHVNTWSTTGDSGNPNLVTPCFEYWTGDNTTLEDKLMTATLGGFDPGATYKVTATVCVGVNTGVAASTAPTGVTLQLNDGSAVSACTGNRIEETRFYEGTFEASATIGIDGNLVVKLNVASTNASWITWRDVKYTMTAPATVSATIGATGWTTFASAYPLDLSGMSASTGDVKAYYASSVGDGKIVMTSTTSEGVAAGTGLMLKGTAGATITIPVAISGTGIVGNMLVGCTTETPVDASETCYVLINNGGTAEFQSLKTYGATIPAGKAYLNTGVISPARLIISYDEEDPTAINAIEAVESNDGALKDGKYLIGNKVVLVKNGVKYGANGQKLN